MAMTQRERYTLRLSMGTLRQQSGSTDVRVSWTKPSSTTKLKGVNRPYKTYNVKKGEVTWVDNVTHYDATKNYEIQFQWSDVRSGDHWYGTVTHTPAKSESVTKWQSSPETAMRVRVRGRAISNERDYTYYDDKGSRSTKTQKDIYGEWSSWSNPLTLNKTASGTVVEAPSVPTIQIEGNVATITTSHNGVNLKQIDFEYVLNSGTESHYTDRVLASELTTTGEISLRVLIGAGMKIKARAMASSKNYSTAWTQYSDWTDASAPAAPKNIAVKVEDMDGTVVVSWDAPNCIVDSYEIQYVNGSASYFDSSFVKSETGITSTSYVIGGLSASEVWYFRVRAVTENGNSAWVTYGESSTVNGTESGSGTGVTVTDPTTPNSWQSDSIAKKGDKVTLGWIHNCEDKCTASASQIVMSVNNGAETSVSVGAGVYSYVLDTSSYKDGDKIAWSVKTQAVNGVWSQLSAARTVEVYQQPTVALAFASTATTLPVAITVSTGTVVCTSFECSVRAKSDHVATLADGTKVNVYAGDEVWSGVKSVEGTSCAFSITAGDMALTDGETYTVHATVFSKSGLRSESSGTSQFTFDIVPASFYVRSVLKSDTSNLTTSIMAWASTTSDEGDEEDPSYYLAQNVKLNIYRYNTDGSLKLVASNVDNKYNHILTDKYPNIGTPTYRVVGISTVTGTIAFDDFSSSMPCKSAVIQWDDADGTENILRVMYNIKTNESYEPDVELVEYIGREHPVAYYGTQKGVTCSWSTDLLKSDTESISLLRKLAAHMGDVYVREPSGTGYFANVKVQIERSYNSVAVPVTIDISRVEGAGDGLV